MIRNLCRAAVLLTLAVALIVLPLAASAWTGGRGA